MATYHVKEIDGAHFVIGLPNESYWDEKIEPNTMLIYHYPGGDIDTLMQDPHMMLGALYDLFQTNDALKSGDMFRTEFGNYRAKGVHVVPEFKMGPKPARDMPRKKKSSRDLSSDLIYARELGLSHGEQDLRARLKLDLRGRPLNPFNSLQRLINVQLSRPQKVEYVIGYINGAQLEDSVANRFYGSREFHNLSGYKDEWTKWGH